MTNRLEELARPLEKEIRRFEDYPVPLEYLLTGRADGPVILFVHGVSANMRHFFPNIPRFVPRYRALAVSLRGHGYSNRPEPETVGSYGMDKMVADLKALVDHLEIKQFHYVGHSMGGIIGYEFLKTHPQYLQTLTTVATPARFNIPPWLAVAGTFWTPYLGWLPGGKKIARLMSDQAAKTADGRAYLASNIMTSTNWRATYYEQLVLANANYLDTLKKAQLPMLLIFGENDLGVNRFVATTYEAAETNPNVETVLLKQAGHVANLDRPDAFNQHLSRFLAEHGGT